MIKNLHKVQKKLSKKRGKLNALHENSRDSKILRRAGGREERLARLAAVTSKERQGFLDRISFFQQCLEDGDLTTIISDAEVSNLIQRFIHRSDDEIEQLKLERRKGRPPTKREELLTQRRETEEKEFRSGFWTPDLTQEEVRTQLKAWNGEWSSLSSLKFIRLTEGGEKQNSTFPPKGLS